jgi:hypothetical protein
LNVIPPEESENGSERTPANPKIRKRQFVAIRNIARQFVVLIGVSENGANHGREFKRDLRAHETSGWRDGGDRLAWDGVGNVIARNGVDGNIQKAGGCT